MTSKNFYKVHTKVYVFKEKLAVYQWAKTSFSAELRRMTSANKHLPLLQLVR